MVRSQGRFDGDWLALLFAGLGLGIAIIGWIALVLAEFGWFSIGRMAGLWLALVAALLFLNVRRHRVSDLFNRLPFGTTEYPANILPRRFQALFLSVWVLVGGGLFFRPHEFVIGGADAGVYVNLAASISNTGRILIDDPTLAGLDPELYPALLRPLPEAERASLVAPYYILPGFYVTGSPSGRITPQFYPLHAVWTAIVYGLSDVYGALRMTGLWALLGGIAVYLTTRQIAGWETAAIALTGLTLNALQIWFARYPTAEALTQFLLWTGLWSTMMWLQDRQPQPLWGFLAGLTLGEVFLVRIDTYFLLAPVVILWLWLQWSGRWQRLHRWFFVPLLFLTVHSVVHALVLSRPYFFSTFGFGVVLLERYWLMGLLMASLAAGLALVLYRYRNDLSRLEHYRRPLLSIAILAILLLVVYAWFIRPYVGDTSGSGSYWYSDIPIPGDLDRQNLVRLGWYLSPLGIGLAAIGTCLLVWEVDRYRIVILVVGLIFSLLYLWRIQANPHQIYTMRRYVPVVMPFAIVSAAYVLGWFLRRNREWFTFVGLTVSLLWIIGLILSARGFVRQVDYDGIIAQFDALDDRLDNRSILIFNDQSAVTRGDKVGTPLRFLYGHDVFSLRSPESLDDEAFRTAIAGWQDSGRTVYWVGDLSTLPAMGLSAGEPVTFNIVYRVLEAPYDKKPSTVYPVNWELIITPLKASAQIQ